MDGLAMSEVKVRNEVPEPEPARILANEGMQSRLTQLFKLCCNIFLSPLNGLPVFALPCCTQM